MTTPRTVVVRYRLTREEVHRLRRRVEDAMSTLDAPPGPVGCAIQRDWLLAQPTVDMAAVKGEISRLRLGGMAYLRGEALDTRRRPGRPTGGPGGWNRDVLGCVSLSETDERTITQRAQSLGMDRSVYIRSMLLGDPLHVLRRDRSVTVNALALRSLLAYAEAHPESVLGGEQPGAEAG